MNPAQLLEQARHLATRAPKRPKIADLCRAQSATYYALFHAFCFLCAGSLLGVTPNARQQPKWIRVYRSLDHRATKLNCQNRGLVGSIHANLVGPATLFVTLQETWHKADYDPRHRPSRSEVLNDVEFARIAISDLAVIPEVKRREFAIYLLYKQT